MRKLAVVLIMLIALSSISYAQSVRNPLSNDPGKTVVGNLQATGLDVTGNVGYLSVVGEYADTTDVQYFLWVDNTGDLRIASRVTLETKASFPSGDWSLPNFNVGTVVGSQS